MLEVAIALFRGGRGLRIFPVMFVRFQEGSCLRGRRDIAYLVSRHLPLPFRHKLRRALINIWSCGGDLVLEVVTPMVSTYPYVNRTDILRHTTVKSSNGLASSIFFNVFSKLLNSPSTLSFVSSAPFTACASNASIAFSCLPTSYPCGLKPLMYDSISSTTAVLLSTER